MLQHKCLIAAVEARDNNMAAFHKARIERRLFGKQLFEQPRNPRPSRIDDGPCMDLLLSSIHDIF